MCVSVCVCVDVIVAGSVLLLVVMETDDLSVLNSVIRCHPELGILYCTKRIYTVARQRGAHLLQQASPVLNDWLSGEGHHVFRSPVGTGGRGTGLRNIVRPSPWGLGQ